MATATLTAGSRVRTVEPWMSSATADYDDDYFGEEPLPDGWEEELANDPEHLAELDRRIAKMDTEMAAGTWVGYSTEEVFAELDRKFPQLREFDDE